MLRKGLRVQAKLIEAIDQSHWIVSFKGQLIQVRNNTDIDFREGLQLNLQVESTQPLQLKIIGPYQVPAKKLDILV